MTLNDFIEHIKHRSLSIDVSQRSGTQGIILERFHGTVGEYSTSLVKEKIGKVKIDYIVPDDNQLMIVIKEED